MRINLVKNEFQFVQKKTGFSWTLFFFPWTTMFFRRRVKEGFVLLALALFDMMLLNSAIYGVVLIARAFIEIYLAFKFNDYEIKKMINEEGYSPASDLDRDILVASGFMNRENEEA